MLEHDFDGQAIAAQPSVEEIVMDKLLLDELHAVLERLTDDERSLIDALFFRGISERELSRESGIARPTIYSRKNAVLKKLNNLLRENS